VVGYKVAVLPAARRPDFKTTSEIIKICDELADKVEALEKVFAVPERVE
jgi:hypothetical protein